MQSRARGGDDLRTATIDTLYNDVDYTCLLYTSDAADE